MRFESRYSRILAWIWPSDILTTLIILLYYVNTERDFRGRTEMWEMDWHISEGKAGRVIVFGRSEKKSQQSSNYLHVDISSHFH